MSKPLAIGIAGLGTVGMGTIGILVSQANMIAARCGRTLEIAAVSARDKQRPRGMDLSSYHWVDDPLSMAQMADLDVIVEVMGGSEGTAKALVEAALKAGKSVVTANKALIAHHGLALARIAEDHHAMLAFEAAVAGGIPIIKTFRDGLAANRFERVAGILNGTCNYILTTMRDQQRDFGEVLAEAQKLGYAEADPGFDIDGVDTAHKLAILTSLAYGCPVNIGGVYVARLEEKPTTYHLGYVIRLLGIARETAAGIEQRVHPCMVPLSSPLASVDGVYNAIVTEGDSVGRVIFEGRGAGAGPTASSIVADIIDIARGVTYNAFTLPVSKLEAKPVSPIDQLRTSYYLRLAVIDRPGVLAEVTGIFRDEGISMRSVTQHSHQPGEAVQLVLTTHDTQEASMRKALAAIAALGSVTEPPHMIRIETL